MHSGYRIIVPILFLLSIIVGFVSAGSSTGTNPGFTSLPTSFSWEGDSVLNGEDAGIFSNESSSSDSALDAAEAAGMVMFNTGVSVNNSTVPKNTTKSTSAVNKSSSDGLSGYSSVGDIIKAQDWAALQRYTSSINATSAIPDSQLTLSNSNRQANWDALFKNPQVISCGGCS